MIPTNCLSREELLNYCHGNVPLDRADEVADHAELCPSCNETLRELEATCGALFPMLREPITDEEYLQEPELQRAYELALAVMPGAVGKQIPPLVVGKIGLLARPSEEEVVSRLGVYQILARLGQGGMGTVYKAMHTHLEKLVAVKLLPADRMRDKHAVARFQREMKAVGKLTHPNIVTAHDAGEADGRHFLVMEYVDGVDLSDVARRAGRLGAADACELARQAALGLEYAHRAGMVHRDIKPSNLMLTAEGQLKILDLGLALLQGEAIASGELTGAQQMMGTTDYMAPEQVGDSHAVDRRADIYSLGCTLYRLLAGETPFSGPAYGTPMQKLLAHVNTPAPSLAERRPDLPAGLAAVVERMLAKRPDERFAMAGELAAALAPFAIGADLPALYATARRAGGVSRVSPLLDLPPGVDALPGHVSQSSADTDAYLSSASSRGAGFQGAIPPSRRVGQDCEASAGPPSPTGAVETNRADEHPRGGSAGRPSTDDGGPSFAQGELVPPYGRNPAFPNPQSAIRNPKFLGPPRRVGTLALAAAAFVVLAGVIVIVRDKEGKIIAWIRGDTAEVRQDSPDGTPEPTSEKKTDDTDGTAPSAASSDRDRLAAEWVLSIGGSLTVMTNDAAQDVKQAADLPLEPINFPLPSPNVSMKQALDLPPEPFVVTSIDLSFNKMVLDADLARLDGLTHLRRIRLYVANNISDRGIAHLNELPALEYLDVSGTTVSNDGLRTIGKLLSLRVLHALEAKITGDGLVHLRGLRKLESLAFSLAPISDDDLIHLASLPRLTFLNLIGAQITDAGMQHLAGMKELTVLGLSANKITDAGTHHLRPLHKLTAMYLNQTEVGDKTIDALLSLERLAHLELNGTKVTDAGMANLAAKTSLVRLDVGRTSVTDAGIQHLAALTNLQWLGVGDTQITDSGLGHLRSLKALNSLFLHNTNVTNAGLPLLKVFPNLDYVSLTGTHVTADGVAKLQTALPKCQMVWAPTTDPNRLAAASVVSLGGTFSCKVDDKVIAVSDWPQIPSVPFQVTAVGLQRCQEITPANIKFLSELRDLESIDLSNSNITDEAVAFLNGLPNLQTLNLEGTAVTGAGLGQLDALPKLGSLLLADCEVKGGDLGVLSRFRSVGYLSLGKRQLTARAGLGLQRLKSLGEVRLASGVGDMECDALAGAHFNALTADGTQITDDGVRRLMPLPNLAAISLDDTALSDVGLGYLAEMEKLNLISVARTRISDAGLAKLSSRRNVISLDLIGCNVTDEGVRQLLVQRSLSLLWLNDTQITDAGVGLLRELRCLSELSLNSTAITDAALADIGAIATVTWLDLDDTEVTDAGIRALRKLSKLAALGLERTQVTAAGVAELQAALPKCGIAWSTADSASPADRRAAEWALRLGGQVALDGQGSWLSSRDQLPEGTWRVTSITLAEKQGITREGLNNLTGSSIRFLGLDDSDVTDDALLGLRTFHWLTRLDLSSTNITDIGIRNVGRMPLLGQLTIHRTAVTDVGLKELQKFGDLNILMVDGKQLTELGVANLAKLPKLTTLILDTVGAEQIRRVASLTKPGDLSINFSHLDDAAVEAIAQMQQLHHLTFWNTDVHDADLTPLADPPFLQYLNFTVPPRLSERNFVDLAQVKGLLGLTINSFSDVVAPGLRHLRGHEKLQWLDLRGELLDDDAMAHLAEIPNLANLNLAGIPTITDAGLKHLHSLTKLISLDINGTNVTAAGVEAFKLANPKCQVNWTPPAATTTP